MKDGWYTNVYSTLITNITPSVIFRSVGPTFSGELLRRVTTGRKRVGSLRAQKCLSPFTATCKIDWGSFSPLPAPPCGLFDPPSFFLWFYRRGFTQSRWIMMYTLNDTAVLWILQHYISSKYIICYSYILKYFFTFEAIEILSLRIYIWINSNF